MDGYKVGGYLAIPNSTLEDDDNLNLAYEVMDMMGQALGKAIDWAIVYGTGVKMPVGYMTRLAAQSKPSWWGTNQGEFKDLHTSHILKLNVASATGVEFFQALIGALAGGGSHLLPVRGAYLGHEPQDPHGHPGPALAFNAAGALVGRHEQHHAGDRRSDRGAAGPAGL